MLKAAKAYLNTQVTTATKGDLLLMLYDTAIKHMKLAQEKMREKDVAAKGILITKALDIIGELQASLNKERGGDVAQNLFRLYFFCNTRLLQANMNMDPDMVEEVVGILGGLREAFAQIIPGQESTTANAHAPFAETGAEAPSQPAVAAAPAVAAPHTVDTPEIAAATAEPPVAPAPVQTARYRAANAYANTR
jgi:flagellar protein FliS